MLQFLFSDCFSRFYRNNECRRFGGNESRGCSRSSFAPSWSIWSTDCFTSSWYQRKVLKDDRQYRYFHIFHKKNIVNILSKIRVRLWSRDQRFVSADIVISAIANEIWGFVIETCKFALIRFTVKDLFLVNDRHHYPSLHPVTKPRWLQSSVGVKHAHCTVASFLSYSFLTPCVVFTLRLSIFKVHLKPLKTDVNIDTVGRKMAALTPGFTGLSPLSTTLTTQCD